VVREDGRYLSCVAYTRVGFVASLLREALALTIDR
jgi:hypothetical protein